MATHRPGCGDVGPLTFPAAERYSAAHSNVNLTSIRDGVVAVADTTPQTQLTSVARAADVLVLFCHADRPDLGVTDIASALGLSKASVHRTLTTLAAKGLVEPDAETRRYRLGWVAAALGARYLEGVDVRRLAAPCLRRLSADTGETATLSIRNGAHRLYIEQVRPDRELRMSVVIGHPYPLHAGASSKAFLAFLPEPEQARYLAGELEAVTDRTVTSPEELREELGHIRRSGHARSVAERQNGAASVAAPVLDHAGMPVGVVSVCGPMERFVPQLDDVARTLVAETVRLSEQLGHRGAAAAG